MIIALIIIGVIFILFILGLYIYNQNFNIKCINIKIDKATEELEKQKDENIDLLTKLSKDINKNTKKKILPELSKFKNKDLDIFEYEKELQKMNKELTSFVEDNEYVFDDKNNALFRKLENSFVESKAIMLYYNSQVDEYNSLIKKFKYLFIRIIKHLKKLEPFEIENEVEFEILKKQ